MIDSLVIDYQLYIYQDINYSSIIFANLSKYILWAKDSNNDLKGKNNSLI